MKLDDVMNRKSPKPKTRTKEVDRTFRSSHFCFQVATTSYELAKRSAEDWEVEHHCVTGILFTAFAVEAMFNHYGAIYFQDWNKLKEPRKEMHRMVVNAVNLPSYLGSMPYQTIDQCFKIRNQIVHGKTFEESFVIEVPLETSREDLLNSILNFPIKALSKNPVGLLDKFIKAAKKIERDIEENGFYPLNRTDGSSKRRTDKLMECPLGVAGISMWSA